jgi:hypothetical protein
MPSENQKFHYNLPNFQERTIISTNYWRCYFSRKSRRKVQRDNRIDRGDEYDSNTPGNRSNTSFHNAEQIFIRIGSTILIEVHKQTIIFSYRGTGRVSTIAIDSTGFPTEYFSYYYSMRTDKTRKDFIKISLAVDTDKQTILGSKITKSRQHDTKHAKPLLRNTMKMADCHVLDRGYDYEQIHFQIRTDLHAISIIPIRDWNADYVKGEFRKEMADSFDRKRYGQQG